MMNTQVLIETYLDYLDEVRSVSVHTLRSYRQSLGMYGAFLGQQGCKAVDARFVEVAGFAGTIQGLKPRTVAVRLAAVRGFHSFLKASGVVDLNPAALVPYPRIDDELRRTHSVNEIERLRSVLVSDRDRCLFGLLYDTQLRDFEARGVRRNMVDLDSCEVTVIGKRRKVRTVPLEGPALTAMRAHMANTANSCSPYVFPGRARSGRSRGRHPISRVVSDYMLTNACKLAGIERLTPHALRHDRTEHLRARGIDPFVNQRRLGHATLDMTSHYVNPPLTTDSAPEDLRQLIRDLMTQLTATHRASSPAGASAGPRARQHSPQPAASMSDQSTPAPARVTRSAPSQRLSEGR